MKKALFLAAILIGTAFSTQAQTGKISGKLTYPGEGIPSDLIVCVTVTSLYAEPTFCSNDTGKRLREAKVTFTINRRAASYSVAVPAGSYLIYAATADMPGVKAYHDEFVRCGMSVECTSKRPITIKVTAGKTKTGITVGDFW